MSATLTTAEQVSQLIDVINQPEDISEVRCVNRDLDEDHPRKVQSFWATAAELRSRVPALLTTNAAGYDVYWGPNVREGYGARTDASVRLARCLFADFDGGPTLEDVTDRIARAQLPPPGALLATGHGFHAYWPMATPCVDLEHWKQLQRNLSYTLDSDPKIHNAERVMRLPGFKNHKEPCGYASLVDADASRIYEWEQIVPLLKTRPADPPPPASETATTEANPTARVAATIAMLALNMSDGNDGSNRLYAYACRAVEHGLSDDDTVQAIDAVHTAKPFPKKWTREQILKRLRDAEKVAKRGKVDTASAETPTAEAATAAEHSTSWVHFPFDDGAPPFIAQFCRETGEAIKVDPVFVYSPLIAAAGSAIGNSARIIIKEGFWQPAVLWTAIVAPSGSGKSPAQEAALKGVFARQSASMKTFDQAMEAYKSEHRRFEAMKKAERGEAIEPVRPTLDRCVISDATTEAIAMRLGESPRGLLSAQDELAAIFKSFNSYKARGGSDRETWLKLYDAARAMIDRKTSAVGYINIPAAFVALTGGIQPGVLASVFSQDDFDSGLAARFLFAMPPTPPRKWDERVVSPMLVKKLTDTFSNLYQFPCAFDGTDVRPEFIPASFGARHLWAKWHDDVEAELSSADPESPFATALPKIRSTALRLALIYQLVSIASGEKNAIRSEVDELSMRRAIVAARWYLNEQRRVYASLAMSKEARRLAFTIQKVREAIDALDGKPLTVREWMRRRNLRKAELAEAELESIVKAKLGQWVYTAGTKGSHTVKWLSLADTCPAGDPENASSVSHSHKEEKRASNPSESLLADHFEPTPMTHDTCPSGDIANGASVTKGAA